MHHAVIYGHLNVIKLLLDKGANSKCLDKDYNTPLYFAKIHQHLEIERILLENETNIEYLDKNDNRYLETEDFEKKTISIWINY